MQQPRERHRCGVLAEFATERFPLLELRSQFVDPLQRYGRLATRRRFVADNPTEQTARQRAPRNDPDAVLQACRQHFQLHLADQQVVVALLADQAEEASLACRLVRPCDVPAGEVAAADVDDLALLDENLHRLPDLIPRCGAVDVMHLIEVDVVGLQPPQAGIARGANMASGEPAIIRPVRHRPIQLGGEHHLLAPITAEREPPTNDLLGCAHALVAPVAIGRVEEIDPQIKGAIHDRAGFLLGSLRPEVHRAETQLAHLQCCAA